jgi:hypothetical protein
MSEVKKPERRSPLSHGQAKHASGSIRERVLKAAFTLFREQGFSGTSMLDIVTRARVSKRDLYALFNNKHAVLAACISERAQQMRRPLDPTTPMPQTRDALATLLVDLGVSILNTVCQPESARSVDCFSARNCRIRSCPRDCPNTRQERPRGKPKSAYRTGQKSSITGVDIRRRSRSSGSLLYCCALAGSPDPAVNAGAPGADKTRNRGPCPCCNGDVAGRAVDANA